MATTQVKCQGCGLPLNDSPADNLQHRPPCPRCGSTSRVFEVKIESRLSVSGQVSLSTSGSAGSYIVVPLDGLQKTKAILDQHGQSYWVDANALAVDGKPAVAVINLGHGVDVRAVERLLDQNNNSR